MSLGIQNKILKGYPEWAGEMASRYLGKSAHQFILHGNIRDKVKVGSKSSPRFLSMNEFLSDELFASRDAVLMYNRATGLGFDSYGTRQNFLRTVESFDKVSQTAFHKNLPVDPVRVATIVENFIMLRLAEGKSIALILDYAETIIPAGEAGMTGGEDRSMLVFLQKWAQDPIFAAGDLTIVLMAENRGDLNKAVVQHPYVASVEVPRPGEEDRLAYIDAFTNENRPFRSIARGINRKTLAKLTSGLTFTSLEGLLSMADEHKSPLGKTEIMKFKKERLEAESHELIEFLPTDRSLDDVAGHDQVKHHLRGTAEAISRGKTDILPMGYLVCGPVGTGKTFLVSCFAGDVGIPMVRLKNFRSQWQGVTESNLEHILGLLKALAPVAVMIDEADAYLGDRSQGGDSGVSARVFSQIASFMSDTRNRGRIIWFLMTARPDLMPVDLKRQGRAEEHLVLFHPDNPEELSKLFELMLQRHGIRLSDDQLMQLKTLLPEKLSGADMEAVITRALFLAHQKGKKVSEEIIREALDDFRPPEYPEEIELQTLAAVMEATSKSMLPKKYREVSTKDLRRRYEELKSGV